MAADVQSAQQQLRQIKVSVRGSALRMCSRYYIPQIEKIVTANAGADRPDIRARRGRDLAARAAPFGGRQSLA